MAFVENNITIENARVIFRNFSGKRSQYNREGDRNFNVIIPDPIMAQQLTEDGWNVHVREPREDGDRPEYRLPVSVSFGIKPPKIIMVTSRKQTQLDENTVGLLDDADIVKCDMVIRPYNWELKEKDRDGNPVIRTGVKAYLKTLYAVIEEDAFEAKYARNDDYPREDYGEPPFDMN